MAYELIDDGYELLPEDSPKKIGKEAFADYLRSTLRETDWGTRNIAAAGTALSNVYEGVKQFAGKESQPQIEANRIMREEAPVGAIAGEGAMLAVPFSAVAKPATAGVAGGLYGLTQPVENPGSWKDVAAGKTQSAGIGAVSSFLGQALSNLGLSKIADTESKSAASTATRNSQLQPIKQTIKEATDAGYVIPPGEVNPTWFNKRLESASGKIATQQVASERNQLVTDNLARKAAGLAEDEPITPQTLKAARDRIKQPYKDITALGNQQNQGFAAISGKPINLSKALDDLDEIRHEAKLAWNEYERQGTRSALKDYQQFSGQAKQLETQIESTLQFFGQKDLMQKFREARVALAKNHDVESALIEGGGSIDAKAIGRMYQRGEPMTGELATIGKFANNFSKITQSGNKVGTPDSHNLRHALSLALGGGGYAVGGPIGGLAMAAGVEASPAIARSIMFGKNAQNALSLPLRPQTFPMQRGLLSNTPVGAAILGLNSFGQ